MSTSAGEDAQQESIVTSNGKSKGGSPTVLPHKPLSGKESGAYDHLEASESFSESSLDSLKIGEILEEQKLDLEGVDFDDFFHERSDTHSGSAQRNGSFLSSEWWTDTPDKPVKIRFAESGAGAEPPQTVVSLFDEIVGKHGEHTALAVKRAGEWKSWSYRKYYVDCFTAAKAMVELGLEPHHGVCILGFNAPEWHISNIATIMAGGISVGLYLTSTPEACCTYALDCKANIIVVESDTQLQKILQIRDKLPDLKAIIQFTKEVVEKDPMVYDWKQFMNLGTTISDSKLRPRIDSLQANKCCTIIYTSGTSGTSKGVMLSHDNLTWMCRRVKQYVNCTIGAEHVISYLPMSHVATQLLDIYTTMLSAGTCWFAQPDALKGSLLNTMKEVHPTIFLGVPRVWEKVAEGIQLVMRNNKGLKARLFSWAKDVGLKGNYAKQSGETAMPFGWSVAKVLFFKRIRKGLGLDRCHFPMTGAAPTNEDTLAYFMSINIPLHEIYGMSETTGPTTVTTTDQIRYLSVGKAFGGAEIRIDDPDSEGQGEVLIRGRHVFMGYLGRPESTQEVFTSDGFLRSGDVGYVSKDDYIYITGRKKELIITAGGEKIAPVPIEGLIKQTLPIVSNALVVGDQQKYLSCLLTLRVEMDETTGLPTNQLTQVALDECKRIGSSSRTVDDILSRGGDHKVLKMLQKGIDAVNKRAPSKIHKIARWSILEQDFSIAGGELTPTMKLKRPLIMMKYLDSIESFYNS